ncbi:hypothetical protein, partial [Streptomyces sp. DH8]|uniref:hypothetical protein n=1 Tax=Streptomyces sp. DH8 TaxID=2857008 RepID=UPI001E298FE2
LESGRLALYWSTTGANSFLARHFLPEIPRRAALRFTLDTDNGAGGFTARFYWARSMDGPWTPVGDPILSTPATTIYAGTAPLEIA